MSRGGRGGKFAGGRPRGIETPFEIDPELLKVVDDTDDKRREGKDGIAKELYPNLSDYILAAPIAEAERLAVQTERQIHIRRRAGPFWTGDKLDIIDPEMPTPTEVGNDGFTDIETYSRKRKRPPFQPADFRKLKVCYQQFFPKELKDLIVDTTKSGQSQQTQNKPNGGLTKSAREKLAKVVEDEIINPEDELPSADKEDPKKDKIVHSDDEDEEPEGEIDILDEEPMDNDFSDEEEDNDDYNAEKYFDDGASDYDSGAGGSEGGGDGEDDY